MATESARPDSDLIEAAAAFARDVIRPNAAAWEQDRIAPRSAFEEAAARGLCGLMVPQDKGGLGLPVATLARIMEEVAAGDMGLAFGLVAHNTVAASIARNGSEELCQAHVPDLMSGKRIGALLLTEPKGGSDAASIETLATEKDGGWILNGHKTWASNGSHADLLSVFAQTDPAAGWRGIGGFLIDAKGPGVEPEPAYKLLGGHALGTNGFIFADAPVVPDGMLFAPGEGFKAAMGGFNVARINLAFMCCGMMRTALQEAVSFCQQRQAFGQKLADFQGLQWLLADVATELEAARQLADYAARRVDAGEDAVVAAAQAKKFATQVALRRLGDCMQAMGAEGFKTDHPIARHFAGAKMAMYLDGATEIQNVVIARSLFAEPK